MKKFFVLFIAITMISSFAIADDEGIGLSVGAELVFIDVGSGVFGMKFVPYIAYENSFGNLDVDVSLKIGFSCKSVSTGYSSEILIKRSLWLDLEFNFGYNFYVSEDSIFSLGLWGQLDGLLSGFPMIAAVPGRPDGLSFSFSTEESSLMPWVSFNQSLNFGDIYAVLGFPVRIREYGLYRPEDSNTFFGIDLTIGWESNFGLGINLTPHFALLPDFDSYYGLTAGLTYEIGPLFTGLDFYFPLDVDTEGISISLLLQYQINNSMAIYAGISFGRSGLLTPFKWAGGLGIDGYDAPITPFVGFRYSF